jgi:hypothetical protein
MWLSLTGQDAGRSIGLSPMLSDPELAALLNQAARNLHTLELLARSAGKGAIAKVGQLRRQLSALKIAYTEETHALTREVLQREVERREVDRRVTVDRRRAGLQPN